MQVKLRVLLGAAAGKEIKIAGKKFLIGRGEECQLRPRSEAISRQHCAIVMDGSKVAVRDLQSRNGTLVNDQLVEGVRLLRPGDTLKIGPLVFEVLIDYPVGGAKRPVVKNVQEVARRTATAQPEDLDIAEWLDHQEVDDQPTDIASPETRQFRLHETSTAALDTDVAVDDPTVTGENANTEPNGSVANGDVGKSAGKDDSKTIKKDGPGKLPPMPRYSAADSREAAADMLKRFFNRR